MDVKIIGDYIIALKNLLEQNTFNRIGTYTPHSRVIYNKGIILEIFKIIYLGNTTKK